MNTSFEARSLSADEINMVSGAGFGSDLAGAVATAACDLFTKGKATIQCAVAGVVVSKAVSSGGDNTGAYALGKIGIPM